VLLLTDDAVQVVKEIITSSDELAETGGLRMVAEQTGVQTSLGLSLVVLPGEDDEVIEEEGARIFLEPQAASILDDKVLDVSFDEDKLAFTIVDQMED
jgi:iron-sulfur cluster assembly protein